MKKVFLILRKIMVGISFFLFCSLAFIVLSSKASGGEPTILNHQFKVVLSGSMEPTFQTGSIIVIEKAKNNAAYKKNQIITFQSEDKLITHRIIDMKESNGQTLYITKGDNNDAPDRDYVLSQNIVGSYKDFTIPYLGYMVNYASSKIGSALLLFIPGLLLVLSAARSIFVTLKEVEMKTTG
ncbi:signal peptidase I SipW [Rossellomorea aquimaris]|uniref:Signal peptidase I n=1 Tax=Rossellomorea aquimaris TaxID=189382 RepID=A0A5D4TPZ5_9BACI|nr:signal peptidase I [Rossellomorea aquimaris]TYS76908.1 signal peptidase I [Rossellomorea aquimaris]TYS83811.1 signal peptidase I [Rossellomorea aquimaris]